MLHPQLLRPLALDPATHPRGEAHLSAASGMVLAGSSLYIVADDEHHLATLGIGDLQAGPVRFRRILPGDLPGDQRFRKKLKPDLESLAVLPAGEVHPDGALLLLGSGSKPNRHRALLLPLDSTGAIAGEAASIDLAPLYAPLHAEFADLNIEGAFAADGLFYLLQRANAGEQARNACIHFSMTEIQAWAAGHRSSAPTPLRTVIFDLGHVGPVPLGFTDGAAWPGGGWVFSAVAEDTADSYHDGACAGSAIGRVDADGKLQHLEPLAGAPKVEGIAVDPLGRLLMVTDSDNPFVPSVLLAVELAF
ncbi:MAG TPA: hypothetical protein VLJ58_19310 [Ramlibacter sp.]|nr:hypothetical protein [Ramlibacter sp.]